MDKPNTIEAARERVESFTYSATGQKGAHTTQTRRAVAIMRELHIPRSEFKAQTPCVKGVYGACHVSLTTQRAAAIVAENAEFCAALGMVVVIYSATGCVAKIEGGEGRVVDMRGER